VRRRLQGGTCLVSRSCTALQPQSHPPYTYDHGTTSNAPQTPAVQYEFEQTSYRKDTRRKARIPPHKKAWNFTKVRRLWYKPPRHPSASSEKVRDYFEATKNCHEGVWRLAMWRLCQIAHTPCVPGGGGQDREAGDQAADGSEEVIVCTPAALAVFVARIYILIAVIAPPSRRVMSSHDQGPHEARSSRTP